MRYALTRLNCLFRGHEWRVNSTPRGHIELCYHCQASRPLKSKPAQPA